MSTALHLTLDEFDHMVECQAFAHLRRKIELIRGELREMNPAGPRHDDLITYLTNWSVPAAAAAALLVTSQTGLNLAEFASRPEPDLLWLRKARYHRRHPEAADVSLAIEVADSSLPTDVQEKMALYAEAGIPEYWIVDVAGRCVRVFRRPAGGAYSERSVVRCGETLSPLAAAAATLDVSDLFGDE